jgi:hypothetical protein
MPVLGLGNSSVGKHSDEKRFDRNGVVGADPRVERVAHLGNPSGPEESIG